MYCWGCGRAVPQGSAICPVCGKAVDKPGAVTPPGPQATAVRVPAASPVQYAVAVAAAAAPPAYQPAPAAVSADVTPTLIPSSRRARRLTAVTLLVALGLGVLAAELTRPREQGEIVASLPVGPEGASITFGHRAKIDIPPGALPQKQTITIRRTTIRRRVRVRPPGGAPPLVFPPGTLVVYSFGPISIRFRIPVTITLPLPNIGRPGIVFVAVNDRIQFVGGTADVAGGTITLQVQDFLFRGQDAQAVNR